MKRLLKGGTLIDHQGRYDEDLLIEKGRIARRGRHIAATPEMEVIDAAGCQVMPGGIDVHTHFNIDVGIGRSCDDFFTGTRAAACGGTTTIVDHMGFGPAGCDLHHQLARYHAYADGQAVIDYSFHAVVQHVDAAILDEMASMVAQEGISSFKLYLTYQYKLDDAAVLQALQRLRQVGALTTVHPENDAAIRLRRAALLRQGNTAPIYHALSRPLACEAEAIARMINLAALADNAPLYIVHLSNGLGLDYLRLAQRKGQPVWAETCPQYLLLDDSRYLEPDGMKYILSPPLRGRAEQEALWQGLEDGSIATLATDHCNFSLRQRQALSDGDFSRCPNGLPGVENRLALLYSSGVAAGRISPERFVALTSARPAQLFGLWPRKGNLMPGADADLVLFDPQRRATLRHDEMHDNGDYSPYEGMTCRGWPIMTLSRGEVVWRDGVFSGRAGHGRFLRREPFSAPPADALF
ncbi:MULTISPECIES: dihydropyrimidinase [Brenneria]|uniref:Dihydropyrimidinase n=1 Tax=Brenneria nigrifluens DSM 30175 = ATCC 13028 TaxID=1121120 RepID=A0A2U1ULP1_9GAMM|nr:MULTISPECIES: dihydropyrimidinase [Brenneria]EHD23841.1 dihydropyrimidinase [Brenneria sp. EniD312]PWC22610.1 dihydropyrimidinase [Brenneria nigrifluens] [Brenneria nigrifluens DSM 30175 = ATCC 13028]QCR06748.1 dihydropyrimidinase [Brenneria nigrifluens] [Brenneria nigrifluens DSM 30175 = ATCC 13028]